METDNVQILRMNLVYLYYPSSMHHSQYSHLQPPVFNSSYCFLTLDFLSSSDQMLSLCGMLCASLLETKSIDLKASILNLIWALRSFALPVTMNCF
jgi:hypothetical protein